MPIKVLSWSSCGWIIFAVRSICADCWKEWEGMEIKVINEYRLNFMDPQHRDMLQKACLEFLNLEA